MMMMMMIIIVIIMIIIITEITFVGYQNICAAIPMFGHNIFLLPLCYDCLNGTIFKLTSDSFVPFFKLLFLH